MHTHVLLSLTLQGHRWAGTESTNTGLGPSLSFPLAPPSHKGPQAHGSGDCSPHVPALSPDSGGLQCTHVECSLILKAQTEQRFGHIFTMRLKPWGRELGRGCLKPVRKGTHWTTDSCPGGHSRRGSEGSHCPLLRTGPVTTSKGIERVTRRMSNLFFHQRMIFRLPEEPPSPWRVCRLLRRSCGWDLIWRQKISQLQTWTCLHRKSKFNKTNLRCAHRRCQQFPACLHHRTESQASPCRRAFPERELRGGGV